MLPNRMVVQKLNQWCRLIDRRHLITFSFENIDITWHCDGTKKNIFITKINNFLLKLIFKKYPLNFFYREYLYFFINISKNIYRYHLTQWLHKIFFFFLIWLLCMIEEKKKWMVQPIVQQISIVIVKNGPFD